MTGRDRSACIFFFNDTATTEIYTLSLHDALPISAVRPHRNAPGPVACAVVATRPPQSWAACSTAHQRSEEHTSELQSRQYLVCRLLLEKINKIHLLFLLLFAAFEPHVLYYHLAHA